MSKNQKNTKDIDPEVVAKPKRRRFTAEYKRRILNEYATCTTSGEKGALLRQEGLYSSYITAWRLQLERGKADGVKPRKRGSKTEPKEVELSKLKNENKRLRKRLAQAELIIDAQKKISQILGLQEIENTGID